MRIEWHNRYTWRTQIDARDIHPKSAEIKHWCGFQSIYIG